MSIGLLLLRIGHQLGESACKRHLLMIVLLSSSVYSPVGWINQHLRRDMKQSICTGLM